MGQENDSALVDEKIDFVEEIKRGQWSDAIRTVAMIAFGGATLGGSVPLADLVDEPALAAWGLWTGLLILGAAASHILRRLYFPYLDLRSIASLACKSSEGAGKVFLGVCVVLAALILATGANQAKAQDIPANAIKYAPVLKEEVGKYWGDFKDLSLLAGQVEQESCISLKHSKCWTPYAELRTARERGVGFGQVTKTTRMDVLAELRERHKTELGDWSWESANLYDPHRQMRALVLLNKTNYQRITGAADETQHLAMMFIAYNGGLGRVINDRRLCQATKGCDSTRWFDHSEKYSALAKKALPGYGKSFFEINREYPRNIMYARALKYKPLFS